MSYWKHILTVWATASGTEEIGRWWTILKDEKNNWIISSFTYLFMYCAIVATEVTLVHLDLDRTYSSNFVVKLKRKISSRMQCGTVRYGFGCSEKLFLPSWRTVMGGERKFGECEGRKDRIDDFKAGRNSWQPMLYRESGNFERFLFGYSKSLRMKEKQTMLSLC